MQQPNMTEQIRRLGSWGKQTAVGLSRPMLERLGWKTGDYVHLVARNGVLIIVRVPLENLGTPVPTDVDSVEV